MRLQLELTVLRASDSSPMAGYALGLASDMERLLTEQSTADAVFVCRDGECSAHRLIVGARSAVFRAAFQAEGKDATTRVDVSEWTAAAFGAFLRFCYTDTCPLPADDSKFLVELMKIGHRYAADGLVNSCAQQLAKGLTVDNVWWVPPHPQIQRNEPERTVCTCLVSAWCRDYCRLGHRLHQLELKVAACNFADIHSDDVDGSDALDRFETQDPELFSQMWPRKVLSRMRDLFDNDSCSLGIPARGPVHKKLGEAAAQQCRFSLGSMH